MTVEEIIKLQDIVKSFELADKITAIVLGIWMLFTITWVIWDIWKFKKIKKWRNEYKTTLTDEQLKALENYKKINL